MESNSASLRTLAVTNPNLYQVALPTIPSGVSSKISWNFFTASWVFSPNTPSTSTLFMLG